MVLLTLKEAAKSLGVPYSSVVYYHRAGRLPTYTIGRAEVIDPRVLKAILEALNYRPRKAA